jgi:two-component system, sensor histidine kinase and response regulator
MAVGDPGRLRQALINLVGNAAKFTDRGEVVVQVEKLSAPGHEVLLQFNVSDTGIGIPPEKQKNIFEAFTQADGSSTRKYGGTGLGLTITSQLVGMMGGRIWVDSDVGRGSTFHFTVRLDEADPLSAQPVKAGTAVLQGLPVLVVDDNATDRRILGEVLSGWGMRPTLKASGSDALVSLREASDTGTPYPLVITDEQMPDMKGGQKGDAARCREIGVCAYLMKPIAESELLAAVLQALGAAESPRQSQLITRHSLSEGRSGFTILVVDDNPVNRALAARMLEKQGHLTVAAESGREALKALERQNFDLALMDVQMPDLDGLEATRAIREKERTTGRHLPIIAMTAHAMRGDQERCLAAGMDDYVAKPFKSKDLYSAIESALNGKRPQAEVGNSSLDFRRMTSQGSA